MLCLFLNSLYLLGVMTVTICLAIRFDWPRLWFYPSMIPWLAIPAGIKSWLDRYQKRGDSRKQKRRYKEALAAFQISYEYYEARPWAEKLRRWLWPFGEKQSGQEMAVISMLDSYLNLADRENALKCWQNLKKKWPDSEVSKADFSFLQEDAYQIVQKEHEAQMVSAFSCLLKEKETLDLYFYGIMGRCGKSGRKWRNRPGYIGMCKQDLLFVCLKTPDLDGVAWEERYPLEIKRIKEKKSRHPDVFQFDLYCENGDHIKIQFVSVLVAGDFAGQEENTRLFLKRLKDMEHTCKPIPPGGPKK